MIFVQFLLLTTYNGKIGDMALSYCQYLTPVTIMFTVWRVSGACGHPSIPVGSVIKQPGKVIHCPLSTHSLEAGQF